MRPPGATRVDDIRPRVSPDVASVRSPRANSRRTSSSSPAAIMASKRCAKATCSRARSCGISATQMNSRVQRRAWSPSAAPRWARPSDREHLERALDSLRVVGMDARRGGRIHFGQARMHARAIPGAAASASIAARIVIAALRQRRDAADQCAQVQHRAADQQRHASARFDLGDGAAPRRARTVPPNNSRWDRPGRSGDAARRARCAASGLALPMSSPRYTCAESTLTISIGNSRARRSANRSCPCPSARSAPRSVACDVQRPRRNMRSSSCRLTCVQVGRP